MFFRLGKYYSEFHHSGCQSQGRWHVSPVSPGMDTDLLCDHDKLQNVSLSVTQSSIMPSDFPTTILLQRSSLDWMHIVSSSSCAFTLGWSLHTCTCILYTVSGSLHLLYTKYRPLIVIENYFFKEAIGESLSLIHQLSLSRSLLWTNGPNAVQVALRVPNLPSGITATQTQWACPRHGESALLPGS